MSDKNKPFPGFFIYRRTDLRWVVVPNGVSVLLMSCMEGDPLLDAIREPMGFRSQKDAVAWSYRFIDNRRRRWNRAIRQRGGWLPAVVLG